MATFSLYNHTIGKFLDQSFSDTETYTVILLNATAVAAFDAAHTTLAQVSSSGANEVYGNGWTQGGEDIANIAFADYSTGERILAGDDISVPITGGSLGPFSGYVVYASSLANDPPIGMLILDTPQTISENYLAVIEWPDSGIIWFKKG